MPHYSAHRFARGFGFRQLRRTMLGLWLATAAVPSHAESVVTVAMTAGDIPLTNGQADQGSEGVRFVGYSLYDSLVEWDLSQGDTPAVIAPGLASKWEIDPGNHMRWIFTLRGGVKFHDGCAFNADTVMWNLDRLTNKDAPQFDPMQYALARGPLLNLARFEKIDDTHVAMQTAILDSVFPSELSTIMQVSPCQVKALKYDRNAFAAHPVGTGPYRFDRIVPHERLEMLRNVDYWNKSRVPKHDRLVLVPMPEPATRTAALLNGQVNFIEAPAPDSIPRLKAAGMSVITLIYPHNWGYQLNFTEKPFNDLRIRRAANYAINRADMVELMGGTAIAGYSTAPPGHPFYGHPMKYEFNPEMATKLLKEAGCYPCDVNLAVSTSGSGQMHPLPMNELVKSNLEDAGFRVTISVMDWNALLEASRATPEKYAQYNGVNISRGVSDAFTGLIRHVYTKQWTPQGGNWGHYSNPKMDGLIEAALGEFDPDKRLLRVQALHDFMNEEAVMIWVAHDLNARALSPRLKGFRQAQSWYQDLTTITVTP